MSPKLKRLIAEQRRDSETDRIPDVQRLGNSTVTRMRREPIDLKHGNGLVILMGCEPWEGAIHDMVRRGEMVCPVCDGNSLRRGRYCAMCDRLGEEEKLRLPGLPVGSAMNEDWQDDDQGDEKPKPTKYVKDSKLKGGIGN